ncbi:mCG1027699, partial [Mus musculus]
LSLETSPRDAWTLFLRAERFNLAKVLTQLAESLQIARTTTSRKAQVDIVSSTRAQPGSVFCLILEYVCDHSKKSSKGLLKVFLPPNEKENISCLARKW